MAEGKTSCMFVGVVSDSTLHRSPWKAENFDKALVLYVETDGRFMIVAVVLCELESALVGLGWGGPLCDDSCMKGTPVLIVRVVALVTWSDRPTQNL